MSITILQLHKRDSGEYKYIQDRYAINTSNSSIALSDGTTQSFKSEIWAELITNYFVNKPTFSAQELISNFNIIAEHFKTLNFEFSSNPAKASLERSKMSKGGTATFIGAQLVNNNLLNIICIGDSNLFIFNKKHKINSYPFSDLDKLDNCNDFLNTEQLINDSVDESNFHHYILEIQPGDKLILATDALSRLILKTPKIINELLQLSDFDSLLNFCIKYWERNQLQEDDISAIIIDIDNCSKIKKIFPPDDFAFPRATEYEFTPTPIEQILTTKLTNMEMQEIRNQFNGVAHDFYEVKRKIKLITLLLISALSLLLILPLFIYWLIANKDSQAQEINQKSADSVLIQKLKKENKNLESEIKYLKEKTGSPNSPL